MPAQALAAAALRAVLGERVALDVAEVGHGHDHVLLDDQVLGRDALDRAGDLGAAVVAVLLADLRRAPRAPRSGMRASLASRSFRSSIRARISASSSSTRWRSSAVSARSRISRIALAWRSESCEARHQRGAGAGGVVGGADQPDHLVEVVERDREALEEVGARLGLREVVGGAADHDLAAEVDEVPERLLQRAAVCGRPFTSASMLTPKVRLERRLLVELVEDDVGRARRAAARSRSACPGGSTRRAGPRCRRSCPRARARRCARAAIALFTRKGISVTTIAAAALRLLEAGACARTVSRPRPVA